jgi:hypothetical protein
MGESIRKSPGCAPQSGEVKINVNFEAINLILLKQGTLTEGEGSVQLTSLINWFRTTACDIAILFVRTKLP